MALIVNIVAQNFDVPLPSMCARAHPYTMYPFHIIILFVIELKRRRKEMSFSSRCAFDGEWLVSLVNRMSIGCTFQHFVFSFYVFLKWKIVSNIGFALMVSVLVSCCCDLVFSSNFRLAGLLC